MRPIAPRLDVPCGLFLAAAAVAFTMPVAVTDAGAVGWVERPAMLIAAVPALAAAAWRLWRRPEGLAAGLILALATAIGAYAAVADLDAQTAATGASEIGPGAAGLWLYVLGLGFLAWRAMALLSALTVEGKGPGRVTALVVPGLFGAWLLYLWQVAVVGLGVPSVLLPAPGVIAAAIAATPDTLWADFQQTFIKSVLSGYAMGCGAGFFVAVLVDRVPFLQRGLLPIGNLVSALPIVGIAPIMVMWFGFDWQSKAAVVVVMTFFPMLVNTITGLHATGAIERDLMRSYAASYMQTLLRVRLPNALPFIFNALKINSTLALIGAIVAEFFGTPIVGMGFRISTEIGRMNVAMVWATIAVAAVAGSLAYGALAVVERTSTFWHPSYRRKFD
ncbi:MAG: ABC transporter permease [Alphaproteobacteria bacterium]